MIVGKGARGLAGRRLEDLRPTLRVRPTSEFSKEVEAYMEVRAVWRGNNRLYLRDRLGMVGDRAVTWQQAAILEAVQPDGARVSGCLEFWRIQDDREVDPLLKGKEN